MHRSNHLPSRPRAFAVVAATLAVLTFAPGAAAAPPTDLFFSEYVEGGTGQFAKAVEIFNGTGDPVDLEAGAYAIDYYTNGSATLSGSIPLSGSLASGGVLVVANPMSVAPVLAVAAIQTAALNHTGNDALVLRKGETILDVIGQVGHDPGINGWGSGLTSTADHDLRRLAHITAGDVDGSDAFDPAAEWIGFPDGTYDDLGSHAIEGGTGGGEDHGTVVADVTIAAAAAPCLEIDETAISFGTLPFAAVDSPASPDVVVTNCSAVDSTLLASATDASGPDGAAWSLVTSGSCAASDLGTDAYRLRLQSADLAIPVELDLANTTVGVLGAGADTLHTAHIDTACPGSSGEGLTMTLSINYLAIAD